MKKIIVIAACVVLLVLLLIKDLFTFTYTKEIVVSRAIDEVSRQFTDLKNWKNWYPEAKSTPDSILHFTSNTVQPGGAFFIGPGHRIIITASNAAAIVIREENAGNPVYQKIYAEPDSMGRATRIYWTKYLKTTAWIKAKFSGADVMQQGLNALKQEIQDPRQFYGFSIVINPVADTLVLTREKVVETKDIHVESKKMYDELYRFTKSNNLTDKVYGYRTYKEINNHQTLLAVGIPVNRRITSTGGARFLELPAKGRLLVGTYTGSFSGIKNLYLSMNKYISDHTLKRVADPLERMDNMMLTGSESILNTKVSIPIY